MNAREMHYDFKQKLNKIDSQQNRNLYVPEIDYKLNEAQELLVKMIANPRLRKQYGFEINQRTTDDIRTIVVDQKDTEGLTTTLFDTNTYSANLDLVTDYWYYIKSRVFATKGICTERLDTQPIQHDDDETAPFNISSFEWRVANIRFNKDGIMILTDGSFVVNKICLSYLKQPRRIHNAQDWQGGTYTTLDGTVLTGTQSSELPISLHREIVDLAVLITKGDILSDYSIQAGKVGLSTKE